jgi:predicted RNase H-like nuclease (RuvC/YqgF family)
VQDRIIRKLRKEIVRLETEIGGLCERVQRLESELTLLREAKDVD